ncbi:MAG: hypothetical protein ACTHK1_11970 [Actinomycetales bacterium]
MEHVSALEVIRLTLHVLAATIWVGGQLVLAALVPTLRGVSPDAPGAAARAFRRVAWGAFAVLVVTGIWNVVAEPDLRDSARLQVKYALVVISAVAAFLHERAKTRSALAAWGGISGLAAVAALTVGVWLAA